MNGSVWHTLEREGKQEEDAYPEETAQRYADERGSADDGASDSANSEEIEPELAPGAREHALTLPLRGESVRALVGLELPVYSTNMERVLETVGGMKLLQQTHEAKSQFLPVKLRPSEPSCKPLFADLTKTQTILLRVRRKKIPVTESDEQSTETSKNPPSKFRFEGQIVGLVREKYVCEGMADFQYFTARKFYPDSVTSSSTAHAAVVVENEASGSNGSVEPLVESMLPVGSVMPADAVSTYTGSETQLSIKASLRPYLRVQEEPELEMVPEVFSKVDLPLKYEFRQRSGYQPTETAKKPSKTMTYLNFHDDTPAPAAAKPDNPVIRRRPVGSNENVDEDVQRILQEKLAQKPVWLRPKLFVGLSFMERRAARRILRKLCYVFVDGPWRGSWIRMGYDPRKSSDSAKYQVIELRNNRELVHAKVTHPSRKRTKKYSGINPKGPRIAKVTQTSEHENSQANKRRRKERFLRGETRRSYLVDPDEQQPQHDVPGSPTPSATSNASASNANGGDRSFGDWDSENDEYDAMDDDGKHTDDEQGAPSTSNGNNGSGVSDKAYEIFGVPLTSANVLFQLDEIDNEEVNEWIAQFKPQEKPTLLGGWYSTHMFLPLREIIRYRIAALVGRSKAELETRRKRIEALKKQALNDYADQLAGREPSGSKKAREKKKKGKTGAAASAESQEGDAETADESMQENGGEGAIHEGEPMEDEVEALEASLAASRATQEGPRVGRKRKGRDEEEEEEKEVVDEVEAIADEDEDEDDEEEEGFQDDDAAEVAAHGRLQQTNGRKGSDDEDDEDDDEDEDDDDIEEGDDGEDAPADDAAGENGQGVPKAIVTTARPVEYSF